MRKPQQTSLLQGTRKDSTSAKNQHTTEGQIASNTRKELEQKTCKSIVSSDNFLGLSGERKKIGKNDGKEKEEKDEKKKEKNEIEKDEKGEKKEENEKE